MYCVEVAVSEVLVGFDVVAFCPFVPCSEEEDLVFGLFCFDGV